MTEFSDRDLPQFWKDADAASLQAQKETLNLNRMRLFGAVLATVGGTFSLMVSGWNLCAALSIVGFLMALIAELFLRGEQPEKDWYSGRALAESAKTLAWRYAVGGDPFSVDIPYEKSRSLMLERFKEITAAGADRIHPSLAGNQITAGMEALRNSSFEDRKKAYIDGRTKDQFDWYSNKATQARRFAKWWRRALLIGEISGICLAFFRLFGVWQIDWSAILASLVAAGAAWIGIRQYSQLDSAYTLAANELNLQITNLQNATEDEWWQKVADAEEAISREHTMWLASRASTRALGVKPPGQS